MGDNKQVDWCEQLYNTKAAELILYGRALGLSHGEAEDVLQETFLALMQKPQIPTNAGHYCVRSFRNHALNYRRSLWRHLTRKLESQHWFENLLGLHPQEPILATIMSNQSYAAHTANHRMRQNDLSAVTFDWTNRSGSTSSMGFPPFGKLLN